MENNLASAIDEIIVLHANIACTLLKEFPKAHGIMFNLDGEPAGALPRKDVPPGYAAEYGHVKFERRAERLLRATTPRLTEIVESLKSLNISLRDVFVSAKRFPVGAGKEGAMITGAITGGLGAVFARREMLALNSRILAIAPGEFHVVGIVEDAALVPAVEEAGKGGVVAGMDHLIERGLLLNCKDRKTEHLRRWAEDFALDPESVETSYGSPIFRFVAESSHNLNVLYVPAVDFARLDKGDGAVVVFDPERGFDVEAATPAVSRSPRL